MISAVPGGSTQRLEAYLNRLAKKDYLTGLEGFAKQGVDALVANTPIESGLAAGSWGVQVERSRSSCRITWTNTDVENGFPVAIMLQYGYGTGTGGYVEGRDYINPAMRPIFDMIANKVWKVVTSG
jgi:hypothetical protein